MPVAYLDGEVTGASERRQQRQDAGLAALLLLARPAGTAPPRAITAATGPARARRWPGAPVPLLIVLAAQALLSAPLVRGDSAFADEALYL